MPKPNSDCRATERKHPWPMVRLGDVCEIIAGQSPEGSYYTDESCYTEFHQGSKCFGARELQVSGVYTKKETKIAKPGALLISVRAPVGDLNVTTRRVCIGRGLAALIPDDSISRDFLWLFLTSATKAVNDAAGAGSCFSSLSRSQLSGLEIPLPPLSVQREIVARLERELAAVEKMKKGFEELAETSKAEFKAELKEVFEEISRRGAEMRRLGEVCELCLGKMLDKAKNKGSYKPYLRNVTVRWDGFSLDDLYEMRFEDDETERYSLRKGDIVMCEGGEPGRCAVWKGEENSMMIQKALHRIRPNRATDSRYLLFAFMNLSQSGYFAERFTGTTIKHLTGQVLREVLIPLPPLPAQREVVARLEGAKAKTEKLEAKAREGVAVCETMRKAILKEAFEGSIREVESYG